MRGLRSVKYDMPKNASHWDNDPTYSVQDWQYEVACNDTRLGYWEWVYAQKEMETLEDD